MTLPAFTMPDDGDTAPAIAPDPFAPVEFRPRGLGSIEVCLGPWPIGELQRDQHAPLNYQFRISGCAGVPAGWRRPLPLDDAKARIVSIVREWIDVTAIERWLIGRYLERCGGDRQQKGPR